MSLQDPLLTSVRQDPYVQEEKETPKTPLQKGAVAVFVLFVIASFFYLLYYTIHNSWDYIGPPQAQLCNPIQGLWVGGDRPGNPPVAKFLGIPYGAAPTGWNRWQPAQPAYPEGQCWNDTYDVSWPGRICYQFGAGPLYYPTQNQSEDCLNLNVWTKNLDNANSSDSSKLHPVLFWIYGGSNVFGSQDTYPDLQNWVYNGDVCVIAPNYRLNIFGYLATSELSANDSRGASGNYGITDLQEALRWVKKWAQAFGCDPNQVTLFGQSSGATNIFALMSSPNSTGLFNRAICLSGSNNITMDVKAAEAQNVNITKTLCGNITDQTAILDCLHNASPGQLLNATPDGWASVDFWPTQPSGLNSVSALVIVDGNTVVTDWVTAAATAIVPGVDLILQSNRDELELFYGYLTNTSFLQNSEVYHQYLKDNFRPWKGDDSVGEAVYNQYQNVTAQSVLRSYYDFQSDFGIFCPQVEIGQLYANRSQSNVYVSVSWQPPSSGVYTLPGTPPLADPFHLWDWIAATGAWDFFLTLSEAEVGSISPSGQDVAYGALLQSEYYAFISNGTIPNHKRVNEDGTSNYYVIQQGSEDRNGVASDQMNFRSDYCEMLKENGLNPDSRFWWIN